MIQIRFSGASPDDRMFFRLNLCTSFHLGEFVSPLFSHFERAFSSVKDT
jgi:hypothetical protein